MTKDELLYEIANMREMLHGYVILADKEEQGAKAKGSEIGKFYYLGKKMALADAMGLLDEIMHKEIEG